MGARIFISYRSADGRDKATALARDLGATFGDAQVFLDKDDLRGGADWRDELAQALGARPVLLLLLTPQLLAATDAEGRLRIAADDDPVRRELSAALGAGAQVIPLLADGVEALPDPASLPPPFDRLGERTWRRLRAYDWQADVARIVVDLKACGVLPLLPLPPPPATQRRWLLAAAPAVLLAAGVAAWLARRPVAPPPAPAAPTVDGDWELSGSGDAPFVLTLRQQGSTVTLLSRPVSIVARVDWDNYRRAWRESHPDALELIVYRGEGKRFDEPGTAPVLDLALAVVASPGGESVDTGNLHVTLDATAQGLAGTMWSNSEQRERAVTLRRLR